MALALFILMKEKNIDIWKQKLDWISEHSGMALLNTHPDYMNFDGGIRQKSEVGGREKTEVGNQRSEDGGQRSEGGGRRKREDGRKTEVGNQRSEDGG